MAKEPDEMRRRYSFDEDGDVGTAGRAARVQDDTPRPAELWQFADDTLARNLHHLESVVDALYRRLAPVMSCETEKAVGAEDGSARLSQGQVVDRLMASSAFAGRIREVVEDIHFRLTLPADGADDRPAETVR